MIGFFAPLGDFIAGDRLRLDLGITMGGLFSPDLAQPGKQNLEVYGLHGH
jgi:hypothetical protein